MEGPDLPNGILLPCHNNKSKNFLNKQIPQYSPANPKCDYKIIYKRYASLYFITLVDKDENQLLVLELIHNFVQILDKHFQNVCQLDLIYGFHKTYFILDEIILAGYIQQSSCKLILKQLQKQNQMIVDEDLKATKKKDRK